MTLTRVWLLSQVEKKDEKDEKTEVKEEKKKKAKPIVIKEDIQTSVEFIDLKEPSEGKQAASKQM